MNQRDLSYIPVKDLASYLPLEPGDVLWLTADLTRLAFGAMRNEKKFSADELIDGFARAVTDQGTLVIPAFNHDLRKKDRFDIRNTKPVTGSLAEAALKRPDFERTSHPLHSFLVKGKYSAELSHLNNESSFGSDSPFSFLLTNDARMVMIGTGVAEAFSFVHFLEEQKQVEYRKYRNYSILYTTGEGVQERRNYTLFAKKPGWTMDMRELEKYFRIHGILEEKKLNGVHMTMLKLKDAYHILQEGQLDGVARFDKLIFVKDILRKLAGKT